MVVRIFQLGVFAMAIAAASSLDAIAHEATNAGLAASAPGFDLTRLPLGDAHRSDRPRAGWLWACSGGAFDGRGAAGVGPWIKSDGTYDLLHKAVVQGAVTWPSQRAF